MSSLQVLNFPSFDATATVSVFPPRNNTQQPALQMLQTPHLLISFEPDAALLMVTKRICGFVVFCFSAYQITANFIATVAN